MAFTTDNANMKHYPGTTKDACEEGYERAEMPADDGSNNIGRLAGRCFPTPAANPVEDSD